MAGTFFGARGVRSFCIGIRPGRVEWGREGLLRAWMNSFFRRGVPVNLAEVVLNLSQTTRAADKHLSYVLCVHISLLGARLGRELGPASDRAAEIKHQHHGSQGTRSARAPQRQLRPLADAAGATDCGRARLLGRPDGPAPASLRRRATRHHRRRDHRAPPSPSRRAPHRRRNHRATHRTSSTAARTRTTPGRTR